MNNATHTPGPWIVEDYFVFSSNILRIADCDCDDQDMPESEISANAHLIAAAPAMYHELETVREYLLKLYGQGNSEAGRYAASIDTTLAQVKHIS